MSKEIIIMDELMFKEALEEQGITINETQLKQFNDYYHLLVEWNERVNLTAITDQEEVYLKHFFDSITPSFYYDFMKEVTLCDIGAGAGFPSIPLKIIFPHLQITIVDSLKKRINFLEKLVETLGLQDVTLVHARAEDYGQNKEARASYDLVTARAVARMSVLSEYCLPLCKRDGTFIALKGANASEELLDSKKAIQLLGGEHERDHLFSLPVEESERTITIIKKVKNTPKKYPRKAGTPAKQPLS